MQTLSTPWFSAALSAVRDVWSLLCMYPEAMQRRDKIAFQPLTKKPRYLIVGIDPRTTIGIAVLDLDGTLIHLSITRLFSASDLTREIAHLGKPLIVS